jgi:SEC-C motif-containing protein
MTACFCGSQKEYDICCGLYLEKEEIPQTPEQLMRSRYTAYCLADIGYIKQTMKGTPLNTFDVLEAKEWANSVTWLGLKVIQSYMETHVVGFVEFEATILERKQLKIIHELSEFHKQGTSWFYVDGLNKRETSTKNKSKVGRNGPCPCGSGRKFKNCHDK